MFNSILYSPIRFFIFILLLFLCQLPLHAQQNTYNIGEQNQAYDLGLKKMYVLDSVEGDYLMIAEDLRTNFFLRRSYSDNEFYARIPGNNGYPGFQAGNSNSYFVNSDLGLDIFVYDYDNDGVDEMIHYQSKTGELFEVVRFTEDGMNLYDRKYMGKTDLASRANFVLIGNKLCYYSITGQVGYLLFNNGKWVNRSYKKLDKKNAPDFMVYTISDADMDGYPEFYCSNDHDIKVVRFGEKNIDETIYPGVIADKYLVGFTDINSDNKLEMITIEDRNAVLYNLVSQDNNIETIAILPDTVVSYSFEALNIDEDPELELVFFGPDFHLFDRKADGSYQQIQHLAGIDVERVFKGDVNEDGHTDLVISSYAGVYLLYGNKLDKLIKSENSGIMIQSIMQLDLNNDGKKDLFFIDEDFAEGLAFWLNPSNGKYKWEAIDPNKIISLIQVSLWK